MNIQIFPLVARNSSLTGPAYKREYLYTLVNLYNKANLIHTSDYSKEASEYDKEMPQAQITDQPTAPRRKDRTLIRPNKKISMFRVTGLKILGRVGTHIFFYYLFFWKKI